MEDAPETPSATVARICCIAAVNRQLKAVMPIRPARAAASTIACASARVIASGFSQSTWAPAAKAWSAIA